MDRTAFWKSVRKYGLSLVLVLLALGIGVALGFFLPSGEKDEPKETEITEGETLPDLRTEEVTAEEKKLWETLSTTPVMKGIDVSKWQGKPDWEKIASDGVEFAMLRVGYHGTSGGFGLDESFSYNVERATENGILVGVYFYSLAANTDEARAEANWVLSQIADVSVTMPVVIDYEMMENEGSLSAQSRTEIALTFLRTVASAGYEGMLYVPVEEFEDPTLWEKERILEEFYVWGARYDAPSYPEALRPTGEVPYAMWQYSNTGKTSGISGNVDQNVAYFTRSEKTEEDFDQVFTALSRRVTAKIEVNLRSIPSIDGRIVGTLKKGDFLACTGESDKGWSRLEYQGQTVYAVTSYLSDK